MNQGVRHTENSTQISCAPFSEWPDVDAWNIFLRRCSTCAPNIFNGLRPVLHSMHYMCGDFSKLAWHRSKQSGLTRHHNGNEGVLIIYISHIITSLLSIYIYIIIYINIYLSFILFSLPRLTKDEGVTCGGCQALVKTEKYNNRCDDYCASECCLCSGTSAAQVKTATLPLYIDFVNVYNLQLYSKEQLD